MELVVDTNILLSFFRENPVRFIIINSEFLGLKLYSPEHCWRELLNIKSSISKYSKLALEQIDLVFEELKNILVIIPDELSKSSEPEAKQLIHDKDIPVFALALSKQSAIWSNEPLFKKQSSVKVFNTKDLRDSLDLA